MYLLRYVLLSLEVLSVIVMTRPLNLPVISSFEDLDDYPPMFSMRTSLSNVCFERLRESLSQCMQALRHSIPQAFATSDI